MKTYIFIKCQTIMKRILLIGTIHKVRTPKIPNFFYPSLHCFHIRDISQNLFSRMTSLLKVSRNLISRKRPKTAKISSARINDIKVEHFTLVLYCRPSKIPLQLEHKTFNEVFFAGINFSLVWSPNAIRAVTDDVKIWIRGTPNFSSLIFDRKSKKNVYRGNLCSWQIPVFGNLKVSRGEKLGYYLLFV